VAHLLLKHGASSHIVAKNGYSALHIGAKKNQIIATTLLEYNGKTECGLYALAFGMSRGTFRYGIVAA
jgi:ankyrin repeat protein